MRKILLRRIQAVDHATYDWIAKTNNTGFGALDGVMAVHFAGKYWAMGGWNPGAFGGGLIDTTNRIISSVDALTWTQEKAHNASPPTSGAGSMWKRRHWGCALKHVHGGVEYVYVCGGDHESPSDPEFSGSPSNGYQSDIWRTTNPAGDWERVATSHSVPFAGRMLMPFGSSPGVLWAFGGMKGILGETPSARYNDLYKSVDGGATWTLVLANLPGGSATRPSGRGIINKMPYWRGRMWLVSGGTYDAVDYPTRDYFREVWSFDPNNPEAGFTKHKTPPAMGTQYNSVEVINDRLFLMGGFSLGINTKTVWSTGDGDRWDREETPTWRPSHADGTCVHTNGTEMLHVAGNGDIAGGVPMHAHILQVTPYYAPAIVSAARGIWDVANAVLSGSNIVSIPDSSGAGAPSLVPHTAGDAIYSAADADLGGKPVAITDGGGFLKTASPVDLSSFTCFIVAKAEATNGLFYLLYALLTGPTRYAYASYNRASQHFGSLQLDVYRDAVNRTVGSDPQLLHQDDTLHIYCIHVDGTAAGSAIEFDGARVLPDANVLTGNAGTTPFSAVMNFMCDNIGSVAGSKAGKLARVELYPALTRQEKLARVRALRTLYSYKFPP